MLHPDIELRFVGEHIGYGTFATQPIPRGTVTWVRDPLDQTFTPAQVEAMAPPFRAILDKYTFIDARGDFVLCWDHGRFVNHACRPTCLSPGFDFELAVRDIAAGEELTDDYGTLNLTTGFECACGAPDCRKVIGPDDLLRYGDQWDALVRAAFALMPSVPQKLWSLVQEKDRVEAALAGRIEIPSCRVNYAGQHKAGLVGDGQ